PAPAVALVELRRLRVLGRGTPGGGSAPVESLKVFHAVAEVTLRRALRPDEIKALVTGLDFQAEFFSGREFGLRVRGEGILLLHRVRAALLVLAGAGAKGPESGEKAAAAGAQKPASATRR